MTDKQIEEEIQSKELADRSSGQILSRRIVELTKIEKQSEKLGEKI